MRIVRCASFALAALGLSGCATFVEGSRQLITVTTPPTQSATCVLTRPGGRWTVTTPGTVRLGKSVDDIAVHCSRPGFRDVTAIIPSELEGWTLGNLATGGVTAGIDAATGAMFAYPGEVQVPMQAGAGAASLPRFVPPPDVAAPPAPRPASPSQPPLPGTLPEDF